MDSGTLALISANLVLVILVVSPSLRRALGRTLCFVGFALLFVALLGRVRR